MSSVTYWPIVLNLFFIFVMLKFRVSIVFTKKNNQRYTAIKFCHSNKSNGKHLNVLFNVTLSRAINKLSLISKLILLGFFKTTLLHTSVDF